MSTTIDPNSRPVAGLVERTVRPCAWMSAHDPNREPDSNWRRLEQDYEFSGGYGLNAPGAGWEPLYALNPKQVAVLEQYEAQQRTVHDVLTTGDCKHRDEPRGCFRVRCQLARKCHGA